MNVNRRYCDCCLKEMDTRQKPCMHSNGDERQFIILSRNKYQSEIGKIPMSDVVVKPSSSDDLFDNMDLCDRCYDKIATYIYSMLRKMENETIDLDNDFQPEFKKWTDFI